MSFYTIHVARLVQMPSKKKKEVLLFSSIAARWKKHSGVMSRNKSQGTVMSFYHAIHAARLVQMPSKKEEEVLLFSSAVARWKKLKK